MPLGRSVVGEQTDVFAARQVGPVAPPPPLEAGDWDSLRFGPGTRAAPGARRVLHQQLWVIAD